MSSSDGSGSPWAYYPSGDGSNGAGGQIYSERPQRKKLELKPRTVSSKVSPQSSAQESNNRKSNPFGAAKPREEVLASKGIDSKLVDLKFQKKASIVHFTKSQDAELDVIRRELKTAESQWREANEMELPEETYRVLTEQKRKELKEMMDKFKLENSKEEQLSSGDLTKTYQRPSERRKRLEQEPKPNDTSKTGVGGYYQSFHGKRGDNDNHMNRASSSHQSRHYGNSGNSDNQDDAYASFGKGRYNSRRKGSGDYNNNGQSF